MKRGLRVFCLLFLFVLVVSLMASFVSAANEINALQEITLRHKSVNRYLSVNTVSGSTRDGLNANKEGIEHSAEKFLIRKISDDSDSSVLKNGDYVNIISLKYDYPRGRALLELNSNWIHGSGTKGVGGQGGDVVKVMIFNENLPESDTTTTIKCGDTVYFREKDKSGWLNKDYRYIDVHTRKSGGYNPARLDKGSKNAFVIYYNTGDCGTPTPPAGDTNGGAPPTPIDWSTVPTIDGDLVRHTAEEIKVQIGGRYHSLQDYYNEKNTLWGAVTQDTWHHAKDIKIKIGEKEYTLQSCINKRLIEWDRFTRYSWEDGSKISLTLENGKKISVQDAVNKGVWCNVGEVPDSTPDDDTGEGEWIYRCYNDNTGDRMNSVDFNCEHEDYVRDTIQFRNYGNEGTLILYRCKNDETGGHLTTQFEDCGEAEGFSLENEIARVLQGPTGDAVPLYRCSKVKEGGLTDYMVTDREDCEAASGAVGYNLDKGPDGTGDGIIGYAQVRQGPDGRADRVEPDRTGPTEGFGDVVATGKTVTLYNEETEKYLSIKGKWGLDTPRLAMTNGLNAYEDKVNGKRERFTIQGFDGNLEAGKKVKLKSLQTNQELKWLQIHIPVSALNDAVNLIIENNPETTEESLLGLSIQETIEECATIRNEQQRKECVDRANSQKSFIGFVGTTTTILTIVNNIRDLAETKRFQWIHANPNDEGTVFNEEIVKISNSNGDEVIRYGDTIMFSCEGRSKYDRACFKVRDIRAYNPVARRGIIPWRLDKDDARAKFIICDDKGKCDF